jgi:hypothetical protein
MSGDLYGLLVGLLVLLGLALVLSGLWLHGWPRPYGPPRPRGVYTVSLPNVLGDDPDD